MSEPPSPTTTIGLTASISDRLIKVLPPAFLLLIIINCMFLGVIAWVFDHNAETRNALLTKIVERCLTQRPEPDFAASSLYYLRLGPWSILFLLGIARGSGTPPGCLQHRGRHLLTYCIPRSSNPTLISLYSCITRLR
jgi:hypothetical protein